MAKTVAETIGDLEIEKIQGPIDAKSILIKSLWEDQSISSEDSDAVSAEDMQQNCNRLCQPLKPTAGVLWQLELRSSVFRSSRKVVTGRVSLYIDNGKKALKAMDVKQVSIFTALKDIAWNKDVGVAAKKTKEVPGNLKGDGRQLGGTFVFAKGGDVLLDHRQKNFGDHASNESILKAAGVDPTTVAQGLKDSKDPPPAAECDTVCAA